MDVVICFGVPAYVTVWIYMMVKSIRWIVGKIVLPRLRVEFGRVEPGKYKIRLVEFVHYYPYLKSQANKIYNEFLEITASCKVG